MAFVQKREWHFKGSECFSPMSTCCLSWWCPCIMYGRISHRRKNQGNMDGYSMCNSSCAAFCGLACLGVSFILPWISRGDIRAKYHLKGNTCTDCLCVCCCGPCDSTQQDKEVAYREEQNKSMLGQPGRERMMDYAPQELNPAFHSG